MMVHASMNTPLIILFVENAGLAQGNDVDDTDECRVRCEPCHIRSSSTDTLVQIDITYILIGISSGPRTVVVQTDHRMLALHTIYMRHNTLYSRTVSVSQPSNEPSHLHVCHVTPLYRLGVS